MFEFPSMHEILLPIKLKKSYEESVNFINISDVFIRSYVKIINTLSAEEFYIENRGKITLEEIYKIIIDSVFKHDWNICEKINYLELVKTKIKEHQLPFDLLLFRNALLYKIIDQRNIKDINFVAKNTAHSDYLIDKVINYAKLKNYQEIVQYYERKYCKECRARLTSSTPFCSQECEYINYI